MRIRASVKCPHPKGNLLYFSLLRMNGLGAQALLTILSFCRVGKDEVIVA